MKKLTLIIGAAATAACSRQAVVQSPAPAVQQAMECTPAAGALQSGASLAALTGEHRLTLVATAGAKSGRSTTGTVRFGAPSGMTATGSAQIALDSVGAVAPGSGATVGASQWTNPNGTPSMMVRFGAMAANQIEGSFTALELKELGADSFRGTWRSEVGGTMTGGASGYFCARRTP